MRLADLADRRVVLLGLGIDVLAALDAVARAAPATLVAAVDDPAGVDGEVRERLHAARATLVGTDALPTGTEVVVRSPGYPRYRPSLTAAEQAGAAITTPMDLWLGEHGDRCTVVGITGTKGKSTTTAAVGDLLRAAGRTVVVAGNIGVPVWDLVPADDAIVVLEISSYQAVDISHPPDVGVLTSLSADHLSWHGGQDRYERDKLSLFGAPGDVAALLVPAHEARALAAAAPLAPIAVDLHGPRFAAVRDAAASRDLRGPTVTNLSLAVAIADHVVGEPLPDDLVAAVVGTLSPLRGRHETVAVRDGLRFVDDALASNPSAAAAAVLEHDDVDVALLVGGEDRSVPLDPLLAAVARRTRRLVLVALPDTGATMAEALAAACPVEAAIEVAADLDEAVAHAVASLTGGGTVLFAPGAPTPARLGTWEDRGEAFRRAAATP